MDGQQKVSALFEQQFSRSLILGVAGVAADFASVEREFFEELTLPGNLVGLLVHDGAAQIVLAGRGHRREHGMATAVPRRFAVQHDEFFGRSGAADLGLHLQENLFQGRGVKVRQ